MLDNKGFDKWAGEYDASIKRHSEGYPFEGYYNVLSYVHSLIKESKETKILDVGVGTGLLTYELYKKGGQIYGIDFSEKMLELAKQKMPKGKFYCYDIKSGLPKDLEGVKLDYIVSSYVIHHLDDEEKANFISKLKGILKESGKIIIADISFKNHKDMLYCKNVSGSNWDDDEIYLIADKMVNRLTESGLIVRYTQVSSCAGVLEIK
ncbi:MAG: methyltransferase domain-containing protein [Desulfosporosinus sp.]|nr:methyltransferase domain-containing protein [Desulfosporosinus sp.]